MLQHLEKILSLLLEKPKFFALLALSETPELRDLSGSPEQRRAFASAIADTIAGDLLTVSTSPSLGIERRCAALGTIRALATLAQGALRVDPLAVKGSALMEALRPETIASIAAAATSDVVLRNAAMKALEAAAGGDASSFAPRVALSLITRASDAETLLPVWTMGTLKSRECMDHVARRIQGEWDRMARKIKDATVEQLSAEGTVDPAMVGVSQGGFLGIAGGTHQDVSLTEDTVPLPPFSRAVLTSLYEAMLNDRSSSSAVAASLSGTLTEGSERGILRILVESDVTAAIQLGAVPRERILPEESPLRRSSSKTAISGATGISLEDLDMDAAPERSAEWMDVAR
jgi:hypothetical protein